jgi:hypothetical protein
MKAMSRPAHLTFWTLGATDLRRPAANPTDEKPLAVAVHRRIRRLPGAVLLTAGYYAGKAPLLSDLLHRSR